MTDKEIYQKAIKTWGPDAQIKVFFEELGEIMEITENCVDGDFTELEGLIAGEIVDGLIMVEQMHEIFCIAELPQTRAYTTTWTEAKTNFNLAVAANMVAISHYTRKRTDDLNLATALCNLQAAIIELVSYIDIPLTDLNKIHTKKIKRLRKMLVA